MLQQKIGVDDSLADLGGEVPARLEQLERDVVVAEHPLDLAEVVDERALDRTVADRARDVDRLLVVVRAMP